MSSKLFSLLVGLTLTTSTLSGAELRAIVPEKHLDLMFDYCMDCHNADTQKGKVNLEDLAAGGRHSSACGALAKSIGCAELRGDATGKQTAA